MQALAAADERQVLRLWEGLGYYRRARQLHAAAKQIVADHAGHFPNDLIALEELPGVGRYTAGAIASIAFDRRARILEANTIRLLSRLIAYRDDPLKAAGQRVLWGVAADVLPRKNVARFNQALMELGSLVCTPTQPNCDVCPLAGVCAAYAADLQGSIPRPKAKKKYTELREAAIVIRRNGRVLMRECGPEERWAGLWDFPRFELEAEGPLFAAREIVAKVLRSDWHHLLARITRENHQARRHTLPHHSRVLRRRIRLRPRYSRPLDHQFRTRHAAIEHDRTKDRGICVFEAFVQGWNLRLAGGRMK